jgi:hypothetical protein
MVYGNRRLKTPGWGREGNRDFSKLRYGSSAARGSRPTVMATFTGHCLQLLTPTLLDYYLRSCTVVSGNRVTDTAVTVLTFHGHKSRCEAQGEQMSCPYETPGCEGRILKYSICECRTPRIYAEETGVGIVVSFGAKWGIYTKEGTLIREMSQQEARTTVDGELLWRSLPAGEDR